MGIQTNPPLDGAILFISIRRKAGGPVTRMIAYDPDAKDGDGIDTLQARWKKYDLYREEVQDGVQWMSAKQTVRSVGIFGRNKTPTSPRWASQNSQISDGFLLSLIATPGTQNIPGPGSVITADPVFDTGKNRITGLGIGEGTASYLLTVNEGSKFNFTALGYPECVVDFYAMVDGSLNIRRYKARL